MGSSERDKSPKEAKEPLTPSSQEHTTTTSTVNPEWPGFQAYSPVPPHGFLASNPQAHPYVWGVQHLMPPYGTPPHPYVAVYPHGSIYAHPSIPPGSYPFSPFPMPSPNGISETSANTSGNVEVNSKASEGKEKLPIKRSKGGMCSYNNIVSGENNEPGKTSTVTANGAYSKSAESASEGSTGGSDVNSQNGSQTKSGGEATQNGESNDHALAMAPQSTGGVTALGVAGPTTNLNIGMEDYWGSAPPSVIHAIQGKVPSAPLATGSREGVQPQHWIQNEKELKRQRRKQSNRESARRSRLRKQAECDELAQRAEALKAENASLRAEISRMQSDYEQLIAQNASLKQRMGEEVPGKDEPRPSREESPPVVDRLSSEAETANGDQ